MSLGQNIQKLCKNLNMTTKDLSVQSNIPYRTVNSIINDEGDPRVSNIKKIIIALNTTADMILFDDEETGTDGDLAILFRELNRLKGQKREYAKQVIRAIIIQQKNDELIDHSNAQNDQREYQKQG